jgi:glycogen synthase
MTRILTITSWYPPHHYGGYELSCFDVMTRLAERGHEVRILCGDERLARAGRPDSSHEELVYRELRPHLREEGSARPSLRERVAIERHNRLTLERHLAEHDPDVVSVWHMVAISVSLIRYLMERRVPIVYVVCDDWPVYAEKFDPWSSLFNGGALRSVAGRVVEAATGLATIVGDLGESGAFCFVSESTRNRVLADEPWSYPLSTVVYSGIERDQFPGIVAPPARPSGWRLLYVGRLTAKKGVDTLLRALAYLPPQTTLACYGRGGGRDRERLSALADALGVTERVTFGSLERDELAARYEAADALVFPSEWEEPFGLVPIEAMACGTPVVATGVGGSGEVLRDGYNCVLFPAGDAAALAAAVSRLHTDRELRQRVVLGGLRTAEQLDVEHLADVLEKWHVAAAEGFTHGRPVDRKLDLPRAPGTHGGVVAHVSSPEARRVIAELLDRVHGLVLDAGCGPNPTLSAALAYEPDRTIVALDMDWRTVRDARTTASRRGARVIGVAAHAHWLPFRSRAFDAVASDGTLQRLADDKAGVGELARVLRRGGLAVLATPNRGNPLVARAKLDDRLRGLHRPARAYFRSNSHLREYTWREFDRLIRPAFRVRARHAVGWSRGRKSRIASALVRIGPLQRFSQAIVLEAEPR